MADTYEAQFHSLLEDIRPVSPQAAEKLLQLQALLGSQAAFYAAFVIVCLEARGQQTNFRTVTHLQTDELTNFTYFEYTKGNPQAESGFAEVLASYQADSQHRFGSDNITAAAV